jgi:CBS-domain-containing membrane protein
MDVQEGASRPVPDGWLRQYVRRFAAVEGKAAPPRHGLFEAAVAGATSLVAMLVLAAAQYRWPAFSDGSVVLLMGSFGATAVLVFALPLAPAAQPRSVIGGHLVGALCGLTLRSLLVELPNSSVATFVAAALGVASSITIMMLLGVLHPPGGATALIAVTGDATITQLGWLFLAVPTLAGSSLLILLALLLNNLSGEPTRKYPQYW